MLISNPAATFYVRASGDFMHAAGIQTGDILSADRVREPRPGKIVILNQPSQRPRTQST
ncbi:S24 family peptidase [Desulfovibrio sp. TomC]|uniref:S24 family peptidase n=1 Tax=Desulfovibrio sp. TomC TaxID=1562888 RepID=UPI002F3E9358